MDESNFKRKNFESYQEEMDNREQMIHKFNNEEFGFNSIQNKLSKDQMDENQPMVVDQSELQFESKVQELEADQEFVNEIPDQTNFKM